MTTNIIITALLKTMPEDVQKELLQELKTKHEPKPKDEKPTKEQLDAIMDRIIGRL